MDKMFGTLHDGSMRKGSLQLFQTAIGAGALSLPAVASQVGVVPEAIILVGCGIQI